MPGLLSNAISGLQASQNALRTSGHNISNANTDGFSRQRVDVGTRPAQNLGSAGYIGSGVTTTGINRVANQFVAEQLRSDTSTYHQLNAFNDNIGQIDSLLADANTGLANSVKSFFSALHNAADDPSSIPARQLVIEQAKSLGVKFNDIDERFSQIKNNLDGEINSVTGQVSALANSIATLNKSIVLKRSANGAEPNDLLDQRDEALRKLAELVSVKTVKQDNGEFNVYMGSGQSLVVGQIANQVSSDKDGNIFFTNASGKVDISKQINGGKLGGLLNFDSQVLQPSKNELGRIAMVMASNMNQIQSEGIDLDDDYGIKMFNDINASAAAAARVSGSPSAGAQLSATITDTGKLTASDYQLEITAGNYTVTRLSDKQTVATGAVTDPIAFDGVSVQIDSGTLNDGDKYTITPTAKGAGNFASQMVRPEDVALASPVRTRANATNNGDGQISAGSVLRGTDPSLPPQPQPAPAPPLPDYGAKFPLEVVFNTPSDGTYNILDTSTATPTVIAANVNYVPGEPLFSETPGDPTYVGYQANIQGNPQAGDSFTIEFNADGTNDNRNGRVMTALETEQTVDNNSLSLTGAYSHLVEQVGTKSSLSRINTDASQSVLEQTQSLRDSISGVNLDEEAAKLVQFQQAYNANAQVISVSRDLFDTLLKSV